ncbi:sn-glycerol 3-phosphate transport system permease protein [Paenibacillus sp. UNCCL117]|uniref:carbohydrate ABC transporter permease n=1 Tax=unclassified Paenibacillus TaxID=185978 RepID=UPI000887F720|nr:MULTISPECIES: carbohydrate ABC transporter permease [unclassified Paenibacillus]SDE06424.1 sn-glycerol 3-phosphate transport system permease protein [Paenibacillus sp. cl123]SFW59423.1 sn-glycerol 3-phosphate transport system permease protein [Paenibacillus sp. UNCCL117]
MSVNVGKHVRDTSVMAATRKKMTSTLVFNAIILLASLVFLFPLAWIFITSMKDQMDILKHPLSIIPSEFMLVENMKEVLRRAPWGVFYKNTIIVAVVVLVAQLCISIPAAYAFSSFKFKFQSFFYLFVLARLLVSPESLLLPNYLIINGLHLYNTLLGIALPSFASAISIIIFRGAFMEIPTALRDSARIDGCGDFRYMLVIGIPMIKSRIIAFSITSLVYQWDSYFWPMVITESVQMRTLAVGLAYFGIQAESASEWGLTMSAAILVILPLLVALVFFQRQLVDSFVTSGIK